MDPQSLLGNILSGLVSSVMTFALLWASRAYKMRRRYARLTGQYVAYDNNGQRASDEVFHVRHEGGRLLAVRAEFQNETTWTAQITMSEDNPDHGTGVYQYEKQPHWGIHDIQLNRQDGSIRVHGTDKSLANLNQGRDASFAYLLRKLGSGGSRYQ
jgi:hypothetical protein